MKSKTLHSLSFIFTLLFTITVFVLVYINSWELNFFNSGGSILTDFKNCDILCFLSTPVRLMLHPVSFSIILVLNLILAGYFVFKNNARNRLSGIASVLLSISYVLFGLLIIYFLNLSSGSDLGGAFAAFIVAAILLVPVVIIYLIGLIALIVAFLKINNTQKTGM